MDKPKKKQFEPVYDYLAIRDYIEAKYQIQTRGYKREVDGEYRDFWHFLCNMGSIKNGGFIHLPEDWNQKDDNGKPYYEWWIVEIMELITKEFFPNENDDLKVWVEW